MSAVPALILGGTIAGGLVCSAVVLGRSIDKLADNLAAAVGGIADTLSNGPRKPLLLQWVTGRADGGEPERSGSRNKKKRSNKPERSGSCCETK